jgi:hypothetical protein
MCLIAAVNFATSTAGAVDTGGKFATGVNYTGGTFVISVNETGGKIATGVNEQWELSACQTT